MDNRNLIIIAIFVVIVVVIGIFAFSMPKNSQNDKVNTEIKFLSQETLKSGEAIQFELIDDQKNAIPGQNITITFLENGENQTYSVVTDNEGKGSLVLNNELPGSYEVGVYYNGSSNYNGCEAKQNITIEEGVADVSSTSSQSDTSQSTQTNSSAGTALYNGNTSSQSQLYYDSQYNFYYDSNGIIRGGQNDGYSADYIRGIYESGDMIDEDGNLQ